MTPARTRQAPEATTDPTTNGEVIHPVCSEQVEDWLTSRGVRFRPCRLIPLDAIDRKASRTNQARHEALNAETVERYITAVRAGEKFPPIVVFPVGGRLQIVDGNHRDEAFLKAGEKYITAYELDPDTPSLTIELLTVEANVRHGLPTDADWRGRQAAYLIANGAAKEAVAAATGLSMSGVEAAQRAQRADMRATRLNVRGWDRVNQTTKGHLATLRSDPVFEALSEVIIAHGLGGTQLKDTLGRIRNASSEAEQLQVVGEVEEDVSARRKAAGKRDIRYDRLKNPRMRILTSLGAVLAINPAESPRLFKTDAERRNVAARAGDAAAVLMELEEILRG